MTEDRLKQIESINSGACLEPCDIWECRVIPELIAEIRRLQKDKQKLALELMSVLGQVSNTPDETEPNDETIGHEDA